VTPEEHPFVRALEGLAREMGDMRESKGWRHFPLGERIDFLRDFLASPETRKRYRRRMAALLVFFFGVLICLGTAAASTILRQRALWLHSQGREAEAIEINQRAYRLAEETGVPVPGVVEARDDADPRERVMRILDRVKTPRLHPLELFRGLFQLAEGYVVLGETGAARSVIADALVIFGDQPDLLELLGLVLEREGRPGGARLAWRDALALVPPGSPASMRLKARLEALTGAR
jgi:tetratricopeptide (TPR) repeat protein